MLTEQFVVGLVGPPFGLKGFVKVRSLSGETEHLARLKTIVLRQGKSERAYEVEASVLAFPFLMMKFKGVDTPEAAKTLNGAELVTGRDNAAPLKPGEFYIEDLKGMEIVAGFGGAGSPPGTGEEILGRITGVFEGGGGDLVEIRLSDGKSRLVPFRNEFFGDINTETGKAVLSERWILE
jgi:16S rRNA processing protein RimM